MKQYITYLRVSTKMQGGDGLGIEAQRAAVARFVGQGGQIVREFVEVESGAKDNREQLTLAIAQANREGATLLIAKLDRLSRNATFIFKLRDSGVDFICADMPDATPLTIGIFAVLAQNERELISTRTKSALAAKKARGEKMGTPANLTPEARRRGVLVRQERARKGAAQTRDIAHDKRQLGWGLKRIAEHLNGLGYLKPRGGQFAAGDIFNLVGPKVKVEQDRTPTNGQPVEAIYHVSSHYRTAASLSSLHLSELPTAALSCRPQ